MVLRNIIEIDEELCDGCGQCIPHCAEGALRIVDGKAKLINDVYCDGLGACIGHCPKDAVTIIEREADPYSEEAVRAHLERKQIQEERASSVNAEIEEGLSPETHLTRESALQNWPVQLRLVSIKAPFFDDADLLVIADCVPFAYPDLHSNLLAGRSAVVGCPKFDDAKGNAKKLGEILRRNDVRCIIVVHMEVPCCSGLAWIVDKAVESSGKQIPVRRNIVTVRGEMR